jgi:hypothetical protein
MGTHSLIIVKTPEDSFKSIYVQSDSDVYAQGRKIHEKYDDYSLALEIVEKGNIHYLKDNINDIPISTEATHVSSTLEGATLHHPYGPQEFTYFHDGNNWFVADVYGDDDLGTVPGEMVLLRDAVNSLDFNKSKMCNAYIEGEFDRVAESPALSGVKRLGQSDIDSWRANNPSATPATNTLKGPTP